MTNQQKFLLLIVLIVAGASATVYVNTNKSGIGVDSNSKNIATNILDDVFNSNNTNNATNTTKQNINKTQTTSAPKTSVGDTKSVSFVKTPVQYVNNVSYYTPSGMPELIHVNISILDGVISDISFSYDSPSNRESGQYLRNFSASLNKSAIIGKKITNVSLSRVGGASLTTEAFMQAIHETATKV